MIFSKGVHLGFRLFRKISAWFPKFYSIKINQMAIIESVNFLIWIHFQDPRGSDRYRDQEASPPEETQIRNREVESGWLVTATCSTLCGRDDAFTEPEPVHGNTTGAGIQQRQGCAQHQHWGPGGCWLLHAWTSKETSSRHQEDQRTEVWQENEWSCRIQSWRSDHVKSSAFSRIKTAILLILLLRTRCIIKW